MLASKAWAGRDKAIGLLIPPFVVLFGAVVVLAGAASVADGDSFDSGLGPLEIAVLAGQRPLGLRGRGLPGLAAGAPYGGVRRRMRSSSSSGSPRPSRLLVST